MAITLTTNNVDGWGFSANGQSNDYSGNEEVVAAVTGKSIYLEYLVIQNGSGAVTFTVNEDSTAVHGPVSLAANGYYDVRFTHPIMFTAAAALNIDASGASTGANVYVSGYVQ